MLTKEQLDNWFTYHAPTEETERHVVQSIIDHHAPDCADKTATIWCVRPTDKRDGNRRPANWRNLWISWRPLYL